MIKIHEALKIAIETLDAQGQMLSPDYRVIISRAGDEWVVWFVFLPETPGRDITVTVSPDGSARVLRGI